MFPGINIVLGETTYKTRPFLVEANPINNPGIIAITR